MSVNVGGRSANELMVSPNKSPTMSPPETLYWMEVFFTVFTGDCECVLVNEWRPFGAHHGPSRTLITPVNQIFFVALFVCRSIPNHSGGPWRAVVELHLLVGQPGMDNWNCELPLLGCERSDSFIYLMRVETVQYMAVDMANGASVEC